jgi:cytochrome c6
MSRPAAGMALMALMVLWCALAAGTAQGADSIKGQQLYAANCAICHGPNGRAVVPGAPNFDRGETMLRPDAMLLAAIRAGKNAMPAYQGRMAERDIMNVIAYLRTLH